MQHGVHERLSRLLGERVVHTLRGHRAVDVRREQLVVVLRQDLDQCVDPAVGDRDSRRQALRDLPHHALEVRAGAVQLVHEDERRDAQAPQRPHQHARLWLNAFDAGDDEHGAVEDAQHALDLGDEVRMPRRVDQVDGEVFELEGHDRSLDRDATLLLEWKGVGLRRPLVDADDLVDHAGRIQQALGESCLTGVYMRNDSQVQRSAKHASYPPRWSLRPSRWT